mgnify:CR=1 FL=1
MALKIILPLNEFMENMVLRSSLFFYKHNRENPLTRVHASTIVHQIVDDLLSHFLSWAPGTDLVSDILNEYYPWMTTHPVFGARFYHDCIDPIDARLSEIIEKYVPRNTTDVWTIVRYGDDVVLENLGSSANTGLFNIQERLHELLMEQYKDHEQNLPSHRANATTRDDLKVQLDARYGELTHDVLRLIVDKNLNLTGLD